MKRFHVHVSVADLPAAVRFYSTVFGTAPAVEKPDYAKWMLEDPRVNFAISRRGKGSGLNHLGLQVESGEEMRHLRAQLQAADSGLVEHMGANCCYARSDKYWITDPAGIPWETFHSLGGVPVYGEDTETDVESGIDAASACCAPPAQASDAQAADGRAAPRCHCG